MGLATLVILLVFVTHQNNAAPPNETSTTPAPTGMCPKVTPLSNAVTHCMKLNKAHKNENKDKASPSFNATSVSLAMCPQLCIMKTMNMVGTDMMPIESNMRSMLMALSSGIKDPKMADMMGKLLDSCMKQHQKVVGTEKGIPDESMPPIKMNPSLADKCTGAKALMDCMNKGLPCPLFGEMTPDVGGASEQPEKACKT